MNPADQRIMIPRNDISIFKARTVEVPLTGAGVNAENKFLLDEVLNPKGTGSVIFLGMQTWTDAEQSFSNTGRPIVPLGNALKLSITMMWGNEEKMYQVPYLDFNSALNYGMIRRLKALQFSLTNSRMLNMEALGTSNQSALVTFYYRMK